VDISIFDFSNVSLSAIDDAIENVSASRSQFGSVQNRLEHTLNNLATYQENLQASDSRIKDVDMAEEMVNFTKLQILQSAGTSMLAQANSAPQSVLKLLGELSILPWLAASRKLDGVTKIEALTETFRVYQDFDRRVVEKLRGMLNGQTPLPPPSAPGSVEVRVPMTREGDEAYLLLRHLQRPDEADADDRRFRLAFARMSEEDRDRIIRNYLRTGEFQ
jgi:hypothetical protein